MVTYPMVAELASGRKATIRNKAQFLRKFDAIFGVAFKEVIAQAQVRDLWANSHGVATPNGEIWLSAIIRNQGKPKTYDIKITAINNVIFRAK